MSAINRLYSRYDEAESDCDQIAGDNDLHMVVIERFDLEGLSPTSASPPW